MKMRSILKAAAEACGTTPDKLEIEGEPKLNDSNDVINGFTIYCNENKLVFTKEN